MHNNYPVSEISLSNTEAAGFITGVAAAAVGIWNVAMRLIRGDMKDQIKRLEKRVTDTENVNRKQQEEIDSLKADKQISISRMAAQAQKEIESGNLDRGKGLLDAIEISSKTTK